MLRYLGVLLLRVLGYGVAIIIGLVLLLSVIGWATSQNGAEVPQFEGTGPEDAEERVPPNPHFEAATINQFITGAMSGVMPGGEKTVMPLFPKEEMAHLMAKYVDWAPEPWSKIPSPPTPLGTMPGDSPPPFFRVVLILSGLGDMLSLAMSKVTVERSFKSMKSKIWFGLAPVSDARWRAERLDEKANIEEALAAIQQVVDVFEYLRSPDVQGKLRDVFNQVWAELDTFQDAINAVYVARGDQPPIWSLSKLWQEYTKLHFQFMEHQARAWAFKRLLSLHTIWKADFLEVMQSGTPINDTQTTIKIDHWGLMVLNKILDLYVEADICIRSQTAGFHMIHGIDRRLVDATTGKKTPKQLNKIFGQIENARVASLRKFLKLALAQRQAQKEAMPPFMQPVRLMSDREFAHKGCQPEFENPLPLKMEPWLSDGLDSTTGKFGFVIYRISYSESNEDWIRFLMKLEEGLNSGWEGIVGAEDRKKKATLEWVDGRQHNIPEGDIDAVRKHFKTLTESETFFPGITKQVCLAITDESVDSFINHDHGGDCTCRGSINVIDPAFDSAKAPEPKTGYPGTFEIIDQLVWTDLYALHVSRSCQTLNDFWALAAENPNDQYLGPTTAVGRRVWRKIVEGLEEEEKDDEKQGDEEQDDESADVHKEQ